MKIENKRYNIKGNINKNIILISDIHYYGKENISHLNKVLSKIEKADYICISGDLLDRGYINDEEEIINWLKKLTKISPVMYSLGNHEFYQDNDYKLNEDLIIKIRSIDNLYLLDNKNIIIDDINFIGIVLEKDYYNLEYKKLDLNNINTEENKYNILLCHSPLVINEEDLKYKNIDLILCGHMHGGIVPKIFRSIFKNRGLVSPKLKLFPKNAYGNIHFYNTNLIVSSGITILSHTNGFMYLNRFFHSEIVNIKIKKD